MITVQGVGSPVRPGCTTGLEPNKLTGDSSQSAGGLQSAISCSFSCHTMNEKITVEVWGKWIKKWEGVKEEFLFVFRYSIRKKNVFVIWFLTTIHLMNYWMFRRKHLSAWYAITYSLNTCMLPLVFFFHFYSRAHDTKTDLL